MFLKPRPKQQFIYKVLFTRTLLMWKNTLDIHVVFNLYRRSLILSKTIKLGVEWELHVWIVLMYMFKLICNIHGTMI